MLKKSKQIVITQFSSQWCTWLGGSHPADTWWFQQSLHWSPTARYETLLWYENLSCIHAFKEDSIHKFVCLKICTCMILWLSARIMVLSWYKKGINYFYTFLVPRLNRILLFTHRWGYHERSPTLTHCRQDNITNLFNCHIDNALW